MKQLGQSALGTGAGTTVYTVPQGFRCDVQDILICNTTAGALTFRIHIVASGGSASTSNAIFYDAPIPANETVSWSGNQSMLASGFIQGIGSSSGVTVTVSGTEYRHQS